MLLFAVSRPVRDASGRLLGVLVGYPAWEAFTKKFIDPLRFGATGCGFIVDKEGAIIAHGGNKSLILNPNEPRTLGNKAKELGNGILHYEFAGVRKFLAVATTPQTGWVVCMVNELKAKLGFAEGVLRGIPAPCAVLDPAHKMTWANRQACEALERKGAPEDQKGISSGEFFFGDPSRATLSDQALNEKKPCHGVLLWYNVKTIKQIPPPPSTDVRSAVEKQ